jgi:hypothetical protein
LILAQQTGLGLPTLTLALRWPVVSLEVAMFLMDLNREAVLERLEDGRLLYAYDLRARMDSCRPMIRIYTRSILECQLRLPDLSRGDHKQVIDVILPPALGNPPTRTLAKIFSTGEDHFSALRKNRSLKTIGPCRAGKGGSAIFLRSSLVELLEQRRYL